ncbi:MAG TPA: L-seryl-tRNA(Sec) selenium transferase [Candidatus Dormibacteraeota bacterium]|nr:L-seryl-tRNA(Sec) selenium transferase [Candidatus Dormibacteraeota bacterium]
MQRLLAAAAPQLGERQHDAVVALAREVLAEERVRIANGAEPRGLAVLAAQLVASAAPTADGGLVRVLNATGVILHTNLGRAPWPTAAIEAAGQAAAGYGLLELDRATGRRGPRMPLVEALLTALTGAEAALVVTNNAAAVALAVGLAGRGGRVVVGRGELVEIGGGVRIPEIVRRAGARLVEVGTTNRTRLADYEEALADGRARLVLRVHASNFRMEGFVEGVATADLAALAHEREAWLVEDLGSGALLDTASFGLAHEPTPMESLAAGADLVTFSGDKLLGGPQAGLIVGRAALIARLRRDPLARAMRPDKTVSAALAATLELYRTGQAVQTIPVWRMIAVTAAALRERARAAGGAVSGAIAGTVDAHAGSDAERNAARGARRGDTVEAVPIRSAVGGGALPGTTLPSWGLRIRPASGGADALLARLRAGHPCVVGRIDDGAVLLDLRTVKAGSDAVLIAAVIAALRSMPAA